MNNDYIDHISRWAVINAIYEHMFSNWCDKDEVSTILNDLPPIEPADANELIRCKDCKYAVLTTSGEVKYCKFWQGDEDGSYGGDPLYLDGDYFCASAQKEEP